MKRSRLFSVSIAAASLVSSILPAKAAPEARAVVEAVLSRSPKLESLRHEAAAGHAGARTVAIWDGPRFSLSRGIHDSPEGRGRVLELGFSQRLPVWGRRSADSRSLEARAQAAQWQVRIEALDIEHDTWLDLYSLAALGRIKEHLAERRRRLSLIRNHLVNRPILSPALVAEKELVELRLRDLESEFDRFESEQYALSRRIELLSGLMLDSPPIVRWLDAAPRVSTGSLVLDLPAPSVRRAESEASAAEASLSSVRRGRWPEPELGASSANESGGSGERTRSIGLGFDLPLAAWSGRPGDLASEAFSAARARTEDARLDAALAESRWRSAMAERVRRISRYPLSLVAELDGKVERSEADLRRGLVPVITFLELEGRAHEQVESAYRAQTDYLESVSRLRRLRAKGFATTEEAP